MMVRRLLPIAIALAVACAPAALDVCQAVCLSHATMEVAASGGHHHHAAPVTETSLAPAGHAHHHPSEPVNLPAGAAPAIKGVPHACDHAGDVPAIAASLQTTLAAADVPVIAVAVPRVPVRVLPSRPDDRSTSSARTALITQLRV